MESKSILKMISGEIDDKKLDELWLMSLMKQNDKSIANNCEQYLELLSNAFLILNIKGDNLSEDYHSIAVCDKVLSITKTFELQEVNDSIEKLLIDLKANFDSVEQKFNESVHEMKREQSFHSVISDKIKFYSSKFKEYYSLVKAKENSLSKSGFNSNLKEESIQELKENNNKLRESLVDINSRLNEFKCFAPTEQDLKNKINEMKLEINEYENYFNKI